MKKLDLFLFYVLVFAGSLLLLLCVGCQSYQRDGFGQDEVNWIIGNGK